MEENYKIDINSDVGESFGAYKIGLDEAVIPLICSANIACGYHAGDPTIMRQTIDLAREHNVAIGAHPGLPDLMGFGRRKMDVTLEEIKDYITYQIGALQAFATSKGIKLQHVKVHGALYNMAIQNIKIWDAIAQVIARIDKRIVLVAVAGPQHDEILDMAKRHGVRVAFELLADRAYNNDGSLTSRSKPGAVIHDHEYVANRVLKMVAKGTISSIDGIDINVKADSICVHGDNPSAVDLIKEIRRKLSALDIKIVPMGEFL